MFPCGALLLYVVHEVFIEVPYSKKPVLPQKTPGCVPVTFNWTFHPNFHPNILVLANLPVLQKINSW